MANKIRIGTRCTIIQFFCKLQNQITIELVSRFPALPARLVTSLAYTTTVTRVASKNSHHLKLTHNQTGCESTSQRLHLLASHPELTLGPAQPMTSCR
ncbi:hypothetical protein BDR05DRAFT_764122 [Suillus weaverae]|nr:hypothetical protein BDR05DRAFT_764122 [Suillus weaverae]